MRISSLIHVATTVVLAVQASPPGFCQATPHGGEFQVNTFTTGNQAVPAVAVDPLGRTLVVWISAAEGGDPGWGLRGQLYAADGTAQGGPFQVNSATTLNQDGPRVAATPDGDFVVVWESSVSTGGDSAGRSIQARRFANDGAPLGPEFQVNTYTTGNQSLPDVGTDGAGEFVVVWESAGSSGGDTLGSSVHGQRFSAAGLPQGVEFQVNTSTVGDQTSPRVAANPAGDFWVVFETNVAAGGDPNTSVQARFFDAAGVPANPEFTLNGYTDGGQDKPAIAADATGTFLAVWQSFDSGGTDTSPPSIQGYLLNSIGEAMGDEFQVNTFTTGTQMRPTVAAFGASGFVAAWENLPNPGPGQTPDIRAAQVGIGNDFVVNTLTTNSQEYASIAADPDGNFIVAWSSNGSSGTDSDLYSVQAQRYDALFRDGFETNDTSRWSATLP